MRNKLIPIFICMVLVIGMVSAYDSHKQSTDLNYVEEVANADSCVLSSINYPDGTTNFINTTMQKDEFNFNYTILKGNFSQLGDTCIKITCYDASATPEYESGGKCWVVTTTGTGGSMLFIILILALAIVFFISTLFVHEEFFVYISGVLFVVAGVYLMIFGLNTLNDWTTRALAYVSIGVGMLFTLGAYIYNSYSKHDEYDEYKD